MLANKNIKMNSLPNLGELKRRAFLHDQAAELLRQDAERHEKEADRLRREARLMEMAEK